jgi:5'-nucleotidase
VATDGTATVTIEGGTLEVGTYTLTVRYSGDADNSSSTGSVEVSVVKADAQVSVGASPAEVVVRQGSTTATAEVAAEGYQPGGTVEFLVDGVVVGQDTLSGGQASVEIGPFDTVGERTITARYAGDEQTEGASDSTTVDVIKATPTMKVVKDKIRGKKGTTVRFIVELSARGQEVTGKVRVQRKGSTWTERLKHERATFKLGPFKKAGTYKFTITYLGSDLAKKVTKKVEVRIRKPKAS